MKFSPMVLLSVAALGLAACSNPADPAAPETRPRANASALDKAAHEALDKANAVQGEIADAEARRREAGEKAE